jgi:sigma-B regulation protein RsbU (phosphoserine phosphatase)
MFPDASYAAGTAAIAIGDRLVMYTDGVTEALDEGDEEFGEERLVVAASATGPCDGRTVHAAIVQAHAAFTGDVPLRDDMTLLIAVGR